MSTGAAIKAEGLEKSYGDVRALCGVDLAAPEGTVLGLLGPNGAGKTAAVRILTTAADARRRHGAGGRPGRGARRDPPPRANRARRPVRRRGREPHGPVEPGARRAALQDGPAPVARALRPHRVGPRFRSLPTARSAVLAGRTLADVATNLVSLAVMISVGLIVGFSFSAGALEVAAGIGLMMLFGYAFSWVFAFLGLTSSSPEAAQGVGFIAIFPLTFASSAFVPVDSMPSWLQAFAEVNPFTVVVDAMRALFLGAPAGNSVWGAVAWSLGLIAVFSFLSVTRYRGAVSR